MELTLPKPLDERLARQDAALHLAFTDNPILVADKRFADAEEIEPIKGLETWTDGFNNLFKVVR